MSGTLTKTEYDQLIDMIRGCIASLRDGDIIQLSAGTIGMAVFPELGKIFVAPGLTEGEWSDRAERDHWARAYGPGKLVCIGSGYWEGGLSLCDLAGESASSEDFDNALEEKMEDDEVVSEGCPVLSGGHAQRAGAKVCRRPGDRLLAQP